MHSPYRILQSLNTHTRKEKASNYTEHDFKITSNDIKRTSNDLKGTSKEPVKCKKKSKLKGSMLNDDNSTQVRNLFEQAFSSQ